jgi:hypothetical protein
MRSWLSRQRASLSAGSRGSARIEHFGSRAVPGLAAKPIVDMLVAWFIARDPSPTQPTWRPQESDRGPPLPR